MCLLQRQYRKNPQTITSVRQKQQCFTHCKKGRSFVYHNGRRVNPFQILQSMAFENNKHIQYSVYQSQTLIPAVHIYNMMCMIIHGWNSWFISVHQRL